MSAESWLAESAEATFGSCTHGCTCYQRYIEEGSGSARHRNNSARWETWGCGREVLCCSCEEERTPEGQRKKGDQDFCARRRAALDG